MHQDASTPLAQHAANTAVPNRRRVLALGAGLGVAGVAGLAACGSDAATGTDSAAGSSSPAGAAASSPAGSSPAAGGASGAVLAKLSDVPVGGSFAAAGPDGKPIVISQPQAGTVVAFSAACTHQGCKVVPQNAVLNCPCHQSTFDAFTGKNLSGPAPAPLPAVPVAVQGTDVVAG